MQYSCVYVRINSSNIGDHSAKLIKRKISQIPSKECSTPQRAHWAKLFHSASQGLRGSRNVYGQGEMHTEFLWRNLNDRDHLEELDIGGRIILKRNLMK